MHRAWTYVLSGVLLSAGSAARASVTIPVSADAYVDSGSPAGNTGAAVVLAMRFGGGIPTQFPLMEFSEGSAAASSVTFSIFNVTARGAADGIIWAKAGNLTTTAGANEATLTFSNSFLNGWSGDPVTYISGAGWTQLYSDATLASLGNTTSNTAHSFTSTSATLPALLNFYNANLGSPITILFQGRSPTNGNNVTWASKENIIGASPASLTVVETPEPAALVLLMAGLPLFAGRRRRAA